MGGHVTQTVNPLICTIEYKCHWETGIITMINGIVLTADYTAKRCGVKTGMALWQAKQLCPDITFLPPRIDLYLRFSRMAQEIY